MTEAEREAMDSTENLIITLRTCRDVVRVRVAEGREAGGMRKSVAKLKRELRARGVNTNDRRCRP